MKWSLHYLENSIEKKNKNKEKFYDKKPKWILFFFFSVKILVFLILKVVSKFEVFILKGVGENRFLIK